MKKLINESRNQFLEKKIHLKLLRRFWYVLDAYKKSASYGTIINTYFSGKSNQKYQEHLKIYNTHLN